MSRSDASAPAADGAPREDLPALAARYGLEYREELDDALLDPDLVAGLPVEWARSHALLPVRIAGEPCVLTCDPSRVNDQEYVALVLGRDVRPVVAPRDVILRAIEQSYFRREHSPGEFLRDLQTPGDAPGVTPRAAMAGSADLLAAPESAPVTHLVNLILLEAVKRRASDVHFEPFESRLRVRYRIDGVLYEQTGPPKQLEDALVSRLKVMARMDIAEKRLPQDGMARVRVGDREIDIRVSTVPVAEGERVVLRLLDRNSALLPLTALGMRREILTALEALVSKPHGMLIVSGPTGSGKTTTLYAALGRLDASRQNILTIEEPIEYQIDNIGQIQVKPKIGLTFAAGLRHVLRQDPDVILVGETRDLETADIAVRASLTGHLVFTTLHTNDAPSAVIRLADMGVENYLLASCIRGVLAQRLVRRLCPACRREGAVAADVRKSLGAVGARLDGRQVWEPGGCAVCLEGFTGRTGLFELMEFGPEIRELVQRGRIGGDALREAARRAGMRPLAEDGIDKALEGLTSPSEVMAVVTV